MTSDPKTRVTSKWLMEHINDADIRILDASWYLPTDPRDPKDQYLKKHIPGARFFNIDDISDHRSDLPHMVPPVEKFLSRLRKLGVGDGHQVVVYDTEGLFSAARVWWLFRLMGHIKVAVLDGGLPEWERHGFPVTDALPSLRDRHMYADFKAHMVSDVTFVSQCSKLGTHEILDARSPNRFTGEAEEPRAGLRSGHIPGSKNIPYASLLNTNGTLKDENALRDVFQSAGVDLSKPVITSCGSGVTAAIISLALECIGKTDHSLYDGSWTEWGAMSLLPIETGR